MTMIPGVVLIYIFSAVIVNSAVAHDCEMLASQGDCSFYRQCVERRIPGGSTGYSLSFGEKYCERFEKNLECFDSKV